MDANGGKAVMSQKTAIQYLDMVDDVEAEIKQIEEEEAASPKQTGFESMFTSVE